VGFRTRNIDFYNGATAANNRKSFVKDPKTKAFLKVTTRDENAHVKALKAALGKKAIAKPKFDFKGTNESLKKFVNTSFALENEGVHAYAGQAFNIKDPAVLGAALSIITIEARHASVIGVIKKASPKSISPDGPFDTPFTVQKVLKDVGTLQFEPVLIRRRTRVRRRPAEHAWLFLRRAARPAVIRLTNDPVSCCAGP